jgi:hypothetical protein
MKKLKNIHIGNFIKVRVKELDIDSERICNFLSCDEKELEKMYVKESMDSHLILKWSKLLQYDFFRLFTQHLIFYAPPRLIGISNEKEKRSALPQFRKNIYTREMIDFILELVETGSKTKP